MRLLKPAVAEFCGGSGSVRKSTSQVLAICFMDFADKLGSCQAASSACQQFGLARDEVERAP